MTPQLNILVAYPYWTPQKVKNIREREGKVRFLLDSGAFTAWKLGRPIELDDYCRFLETIEIQPWRYFTLDVIGDIEATHRNYETMRRRGFNPIPVFTRGEPMSQLDKLYKHSDIVGIGGIAGVARKPTQYMAAMFKYLKGRPVHVLGFSNFNWLKYAKPYSCDSSSWSSAARYGGMSLYMGNGRMTNKNRADFAERPSDEVRRRIMLYDVAPAGLREEQAWRGVRGLSNKVNAGSWVHFSVECERELGTMMFLAITDDTVSQLLFTQYDRLLAEGILG